MRLWQPANTAHVTVDRQTIVGAKGMMGVHTSINTVHAVTKADSNNFLGQHTNDIVIAFQVAKR